MFLRVQPTGVQTLNDEDRMAVWHVTSGDEWVLSMRLTMPGYPQTGADPSNTHVRFVLAETRFSAAPLWTGEWNAGIQPVGPEHPGLVTVRVPDTITGSLRRGAYAFSVTVSDRFNRNATTVVTGTVQVEYEPTSPVHNIPYRSDS